MEVEALRAEELRRLQDRRLRKAVRYAYQNVPFFRRRLREAGIRPEEIRGAEDLASLPMTTASDLSRTYPFGLLAVPMSEVVRFHISAGGAGGSIALALTAKDLASWGEVNARAFTYAGARKGDIVHNAHAYDPLGPGWGFHYGGESLGLAVIPAGPGPPREQLALLEELGSTILCATPQYTLTLAVEAERLGYSARDDLRVRLGIFWGDPVASSECRKLEDLFGLRALECYGPMEAGGPALGVECLGGDGLHLWADQVVAEAVDPGSGDVLGPGESGELVLTLLEREAVPLLRYRTGHVAILDEGPCSCGMHHPRMFRVALGNGGIPVVRGKRGMEEGNPWEKRRPEPGRPQGLPQEPGGVPGRGILRRRGRSRDPGAPERDINLFP
jgi:phenylacetate-CoA ligase